MIWRLVPLAILQPLRFQKGVSVSGDPLLEDDEDGESTDAKKKKHDDFLLAEYSSITQAYFNTTTTIATFFRNYLLIVGLPVPVLGFLLTQFTKAGGTLPPIPDEIAFLIPLIGCVIGVLGLCVMVFIVNLRLDAILYARTVNGIRKRFYDESGLTYPDELRIRVLPRSVYQPRYFEWRYFLSVVAVFGLLNTLYPVLGWSWYLHHLGATVAQVAWTCVGIAVVWLAVHVVVYWVLTRHRETKYLRTYIIGVDIDGVLNKHREHFCRLLQDFREKTINSAQITFIPVHQCPGLGVTEAEEHAVLNHPLYWTGLPPVEGAAKFLAKLKNTFGYTIVIFTHRPWPEPKDYPQGEEERYRNLWSYQRAWHPLAFDLIRALTKAWLGQHGIPYNRLVIERGNVHTTDRRIRVNNRFTISEREEIRLFVEDDLFKARKLAHICEVVFLLDQPYNQANDLPKNVVRVQLWEQIYEFIRQQL
jgi:uncharacterized HAD superfamily protein